MAKRRRDRRRRLTPDERRSVFARAVGKCQQCGEELPDNWHESHLIAWSKGGATSVASMEAWCPKCNLRLGDHPARPKPELELRQWQTEAFDDILLALNAEGRATVNAAPGAGKTIFAGLTYRHLEELGLVDRLLVVTFNRVLTGQWRRDLGGALGIHLDDNPHLGWRELGGTDGPVVTYANLTSALRDHRAALFDDPTLVVFDEVHHLGTTAAWGVAATKLLRPGEDHDQPPALVLNTTGTLFRSPTERGRQRMPTVAYRTVDEGGREFYEATADYTVTADRLISGGELRPIDLHTCGSTIELIDLAEGEVIAGEVADLPDKRTMRAAHSRIIEKPEWMRGFAGHMLDRLKRQDQEIGYREPLKALWIAKNQKTARIAADIIDDVAGADFSRLVISDEPASLRTLRRAVDDPVSCCIVAVQMVSEGFDCAEVSTIAYANDWLADLFLTQMVGRAMRLTPTERARGHAFPAQVLIPDVADLRAAFVNVLVAKMHLLEVDFEPLGPARESPAGDGFALPRYDLQSVSEPRLDDVVVVGEEEGVVLRSEEEAMAALCDARHVPTIYAARFVLIEREWRGQRVLIDRPPPEVRPAHPRDVNLALRDRAKNLAGWWAHNGDTSIAQFQAEANAAAGLAPGGRADATEADMKTVVSWMANECRLRAEGLGTAAPKAAGKE